MHLAAIATIMSLALSSFGNAQPGRSVQSRSQSDTRQLAAVRGEVVRIARAARGTLLITVRPPRGFSEVTVLARENDLVGSAVSRLSDSGLLGLLSDDDPDEEAITAAELNEGDVVSVIFDPAIQNKAIEIYIH
jgi:hypothetical protein